jgi:hypothetical protein
VSSVAGGAVGGYALKVSSADSAGLPPVGRDLDGAGVPDTCDLDDDGDGVPDATDDCPTVSNGPDTPAPALESDGFVLTWLAVGPFTGTSTTGDCRPSDDVLVGEDAPMTATIGTAVGSLQWSVHLLGWYDFDFLPSYGFVDPAREVYALVYLRSDTARTLTLAVGADDGVFAWFNGTQVLDVSSCQGVVYDQFQVPVDVNAGWNTLLFKVRDQGGGWGLAARFLDGGVAVTDLEPSLVPDASWTPSQADADGDGQGDVCDDTPG